jgi:hypothetical protein
MHRKRVNVSTVLAGQRLGIEEVDDGIWIVNFMRYDLGFSIWSKSPGRVAEEMGFEPKLGFEPIG